MARGIKTGGRDFAPGVSGNPNGRRKMSAELKEVRAQTVADLIVDLNSLLGMSRPEFDEYKPKNMLQIICKHAVGSAADGSLAWVREIFDRTLGKPSQAMAIEMSRAAMPIDAAELKTMITQALRS